MLDVKEYFRERYHRFKNEHKCVVCGERLEESRIDIKCEFCRAKSRAAEQKCYQKKKLRRSKNERRCEMTTNLYMVLDANYNWCCFAFDISRNRAKSAVAKEFGNDYTEMRCKTLKKGVNVPVPMLVTHPEDKGYDIVQNCGYSYATDE